MNGCWTGLMMAILAPGIPAALGAAAFKFGWWKIAFKVLLAMLKKKKDKNADKEEMKKKSSVVKKHSVNSDGGVAKAASPSKKPFSFFRPKPIDTKRMSNTSDTKPAPPGKQSTAQFSRQPSSDFRPNYHPRPAPQYYNEEERFYDEPVRGYHPRMDYDDYEMDYRRPPPPGMDYHHRRPPPRQCTYHRPPPPPARPKYAPSRSRSQSPIRRQNARHFHPPAAPRPTPVLSPAQRRPVPTRSHSPQARGDKSFSPAPRMPRPKVPTPMHHHMPKRQPMQPRREHQYSDPWRKRDYSEAPPPRRVMSHEQYHGTLYSEESEFRPTLLPRRQNSNQYIFPCLKVCLLNT